MRTRLKLFLEWGIVFGKPYEIMEKSARKVEYADRFTLEEEIIRRQAVCEEISEKSEAAEAASGGITHSAASINLDPFVQKQESAKG